MSPELMISYSDVGWIDFVDSGEHPIELCLRKQVPVYFKVDTHSWLIYRDYKIRLVAAECSTIFRRVPRFSLLGPVWEIGGFSLMREYVVSGFQDDLLFLCLDDLSLAEIRVSGSALVARFSSAGFSLSRPFQNVGFNQNGQVIKKHERIQCVNLEGVVFDTAFLVDKKQWSSSPVVPSQGSPASPEAFSVQVVVNKLDLWFLNDHIEVLRGLSNKKHGYRHYPFRHEQHMPALYWMFQAAYLLNAVGSLKDRDVESWLKNNAPGHAFSYRVMRTVAKFVRPNVHRSKGGGRRGRFVIDSFCPGSVASDYQFDFVSEGFSLILAIADWWFEGLGDNKVVLAKKLNQNSFAGLEIGDIVYLISGSKLEVKDLEEYMRYEESQGEKIRFIVDGQAELCLSSSKKVGSR